MSDALDRVVPEDDGKSRKGLYRHDAEGSDDMPVCVFPLLISLSFFHIHDLFYAIARWAAGLLNNEPKIDFGLY